jgi:hypothetical protein
MLRRSMRGADEQQSQMFSYLSPEQRVRKDHPLRAIRMMVDEVLRELSPQFSRMYAREGRPSAERLSWVVESIVGHSAANRSIVRAHCWIARPSISARGAFDSAQSVNFREGPVQPRLQHLAAEGSRGFKFLGRNPIGLVDHQQNVPDVSRYGRDECHLIASDWRISTNDDDRRVDVRNKSLSRSGVPGKYGA